MKLCASECWPKPRFRPQVRICEGWISQNETGFQPFSPERVQVRRKHPAAEPFVSHGQRSARHFIQSGTLRRTPDPPNAAIRPQFRRNVARRQLLPQLDAARRPWVAAWPSELGSWWLFRLGRVSAAALQLFRWFDVQLQRSAPLPRTVRARAHQQNP